MDDRAAILRLKQGDINGLEALISRYQLKATRTAFLIVQDEALAQDVVQEMFVRLADHIGQYDESRPFEPYLMRSVVNASLNAVRRNKEVLSLDNDSVVENLLDQAASVESQVEFAQLQREILSTLSKLSPRQRTAIVQRYYLEMGEQEMSAALNVAPGTVKWLLNAARERLRHLLGQKGPSHE